MQPCPLLSQVSYVRWNSLGPIELGDRPDVYSRENESVPVEPIRIARIKSHEFVEHNVGDGCHAHRGARVPGVSLDRGIDLSECQNLRVDNMLNKSVASRLQKG